MEHERLEYREAIEWLARRAGMELPDEETEEERRARLEREKALEVMKLAARFYFDNLRKPEGRAAADYIKRRGLDETTVVEFGMGCSTDFYSLPDFFAKKGYDARTLKNAGLVSDVDGRLIDFFGGRLIIPIINARDQVIGFGGRTLEKDKLPKYKNSSGTILFDKRKVLFGINLIKKLQQSENVNDIILVEGYMDVISLRQAGVKNAVASMGTSLTVEQCRELRKYTNTVFVSFDGDAAGQNATWRSLDLLAAAGLEVRVIKMPEGLDPDDTIKKEGCEGYMRYKSAALPLIDFKLKSLAARYNLSTADGKNKFAKSTLGILGALDPIARDLYIKEVSSMSGLSTESIINSLAQAKATPSAPERANTEQDSAQPPETNARIVAARFLLSAVFGCKDYVQIDDLNEEYLEYPPHKEIAAYINACIARKEPPKIGALFDFVEDKSEIDRITEAANGVPASEEREYYRKCVETLQKGGLQKRRTYLLEKIKSTADDKERELLKEELRKLLRR